jgi:hypothetical protein
LRESDSLTLTSIIFGAAQKGNSSRLKAALQRKDANPNCSDEFGRTPLQYPNEGQKQQCRSFIITF